MKIPVRLQQLMNILPHLEKFMNDENPAIEVLVQNLVYEIAKELNETLDEGEMDV